MLSIWSGASLKSLDGIILFVTQQHQLHPWHTVLLRWGKTEADILQTILSASFKNSRNAGLLVLLEWIICIRTEILYFDIKSIQPPSPLDVHGTDHFLFIWLAGKKWMLSNFFEPMHNKLRSGCFSFMHDGARNLKLMFWGCPWLLLRRTLLFWIPSFDTNPSSVL